MKLLLFIALLFLCSCTMYMPKPVRAQNLVRRYLDSANKPDKIQVLKFGDLMTFNADYFNHQNQLADKLDPYYKNMTDSGQAHYRKVRDTVQRNFKGYEIFCTYIVNNVTHTTLFKIDTTITSVRTVAEMDGKPQ